MKVYNVLGFVALAHASWQEWSAGETTTVTETVRNVYYTCPCDGLKKAEAATATWTGLLTVASTTSFMSWTENKTGTLSTSSSSAPGTDDPSYLNTTLPVSTSASQPSTTTSTVGIALDTGVNTSTATTPQSVTTTLSIVTVTATTSTTSVATTVPARTAISSDQPFVLTASIGSVGSEKLRRRAAYYVSFSGENAYLTTDHSQAIAFAITSAGELTRYDNGLSVGSSSLTDDAYMMYWAAGTHAAQTSGWTAWSSGLAYPGANLLVSTSTNFIEIAYGEVPSGFESITLTPVTDCTDCTLAVTTSLSTAASATTTASLSTSTNSLCNAIPESSCGGVINSGTHDYLITCDNVYDEMWHAQLAATTFNDCMATCDNTTSSQCVGFSFNECIEAQGVSNCYIAVQQGKFVDHTVAGWVSGRRQ